MSFDICQTWRLVVSSMFHMWFLLVCWMYQGVSIVNQQRHLFECLDFIKDFGEAMHEQWREEFGLWIVSLVCFFVSSTDSNLCLHLLYSYVTLFVAFPSFFEKKHIILKEERIQKEAAWTRSPPKHKLTEGTRQPKKNRTMQYAWAKGKTKEVVTEETLKYPKMLPPSNPLVYQRSYSLWKLLKSKHPLFYNQI